MSQEQCKYIKLRICRWGYDTQQLSDEYLDDLFLKFDAEFKFVRSFKSFNLDDYLSCFAVTLLDSFHLLNSRPASPMNQI